MNPLQHLNPIEKNLCNKADMMKVPIAGNIELLPLCNMDCKMCFAKMTREQMEAHHPLIDYQTWIEYGKQMSNAGTIFMLFTGGEPLLYPHFDELYVAYKKMGFIVSVNTNGTLINEKWAKLFKEYPPRRLNITMYGSNDETYGKLCNNPKGFTQMINGVKLLKEYGVAVKFNCSLTPYNINEQIEMWNVANDLGIAIEMGNYMFPPVRKNNIGNEQYRLSPKDSALAKITYERLLTGDHFPQRVIDNLDSIKHYQKPTQANKGYTCRSGNSVFWVNYDGTMSACSFTPDYQVSLEQESFVDAWQKILAHVGNSTMPTKCYECKKKPLCQYCAAACISETGSIHQHPQYCCDVTDEYILLLEKYKEEIENEIKS